MKALKKTLCALFAALTALTLILTGACANSQNSGKIQIVCTIFPQYDWVRELTDGAENVEVTLLEDSGADLHNFQPSAADKVAILNSDLFVYIGGESDEWAKTLLKNADREVRSLDLLDALGDRALTEEEGIQDSGEHDHDHDEIDEHIWLSPQNALDYCRELAEVITALDPEHGREYLGNAASYLEKLTALDEEYRQVIASCPGDSLIFADRFPFIYLVEDYGLSYYAAFPGCSAETEASFATIIELADKLNELESDALIITEHSSDDIARAIINAAGRDDVAVYEMNSLQSVSQKDVAGGLTYLGAMEENLRVLAKALN